MRRIGINFDAVKGLSDGTLVDTLAALGFGATFSGVMADAVRQRELAELLKKKGIRLAFENQRLLYNLAWILEVCRDEETVAFCWDAGHEGCFTPGREYMPLFSDRLIALHLHDNRGVYNADDHMLPLDGMLDYGRITRQIRESGYTGTMMLEVFAKEAFYGGVSPEEFLARAARAAKELIKRTDG